MDLAPRAESPIAKSAFFAADLTLRDAAEREPHAVRAGSFFASWAQGADYPTWLAPPASGGALVTNLSVHLFVQATGPVAKTFRFPDILVYVGSGDAWMGYGNASTDPLLLPGRVYEFRVAVASPAGGLWLPQGERLGVKVVPVMHQNDAADVTILVGGGMPSGIAWTEAPYGDAPTAFERGEDKGDVKGSAYAGAAAPSAVRHVAKLRLDAAPRALVVWMNTTSHEGIPDIDLQIESPNGTVLAFSGTPTPREALRLAAPNFARFEPGEYSLVATSYGSARATVTLAWALARS